MANIRYFMRDDHVMLRIYCSPLVVAYLPVPRPLAAIERASGSVKEIWPSGACDIFLRSA